LDVSQIVHTSSGLKDGFTEQAFKRVSPSCVR